MALQPIRIEDCPQFYTARILNRENLLQPEKYKQMIIESLQYLVKVERVAVHAYVLMDNHIHFIWKPMPLYSLKHSQLSFMKFTAQRIKRDLELNNEVVLSKFLVNAKDRTYQFWKRNPLCVDLLSDNVIEQKLKYIHHNPVKAGICENAQDYRYSSARFYAELGDEFGFLSDYRV
jgi:REP element-mobilizing transposase RayT